MEEPGYNKASAVFQNNGCIIECVPVDKDGLCTEKAIGGNGHWRYLLHPFTSVSNRQCSDNQQTI